MEMDVPISYTPFTLPLLLASLAALGVARYAWPRRHTVGVKTFIYLALAESLWSAAYALELGANTQETATLLIKIEYFSIASIPALWLVFAIQYTEREEWLTRRNLLLLLIVPLLTLALAWTNESHSLIWNITGRSSGFTSLMATWQCWAARYS
jgi:hypothetical protein